MFKSDEEWEEDIDSTIYLPKEDMPEEWIPTYRQRAIAGLVLAALYALYALAAWEPSVQEILIVGSVLIALTLLLGEKFVKFITYITSF